MRPLPVALVAAVLVGAISGGCATVTVSKDELARLRAERQAAIDQAERLGEENRQLQAQLRQRQEQIDSLLALGPKRLDALNRIARIRLGRFTGGADTDDSDGKPGDDAVKVYLEPIDQDGSVVKAAGEVTVQLFDLAAKADANRIATHTWKVEDLAKCWSGGFLGGRYSLTCAWKAPPAHAEITVRVAFTDYLTGRHFTAQKLCKIDLPAPATQP